MTYEIEYNCRQAGRFRGEPADAATTGRSDRTDGVHRALLDGSVRFFDESIALPIWPAIGTRAGGELIVGF